MMNLKPNRSTFEITPQQRTREPVVHRFSRASVIFGTLIGFPVGLYLWLFLKGNISEVGDYAHLVNLHAMTQMVMFFGLFILGFAYTAGYHLNGGQPRPVNQVKWVLSAVVAGYLIWLIPSLALFGQLVMSLAFAYTAALMINAARQGGLSKPAITFLCVPGLITFALMPWLNLTDVKVAWFAVMCGPFLMALMAGLQLVPNVMKGARLEGASAWWFAGLMLLNCAVIAIDTFVTPVNLLFSSGLMILALLFYLNRVKFLQALNHCGPTSLAFAFVFAFGWVFIALVLLAIHGEGFRENALHLIILGQITTYILAVGSRVIGFFSGDYVITDGRLTYLVLLWQLVPATRGLDYLTDSSSATAWLTVAVAVLVLYPWAYRMLMRIKEV